MTGSTTAPNNHSRHRAAADAIGASVLPPEVYREIALARWEDDGGRVVDGVAVGSRGPRPDLNDMPASITASLDHQWRVS